MYATNPKGLLTEIPECVLTIPNGDGKGKSCEIILNNLPDISDTKQAHYNNEAIMGRSFPLYTYSYSGDRGISISFHFFILKKQDGIDNINNLRKIQSAVYPREGEKGAPFTPPVICQFKCGKLLGETPLCLILQSYSVKFPTDVAWDEETYCPYKFDVETSWLTVYTSEELPDQSQIIKSGR